MKASARPGVFIGVFVSSVSSDTVSPAIEARRLLRARHHGVLSTLSCRIRGYPFGSVVPFVLDQQARPVILISRLAEHTKNLEADRRASLLARGDDDDIQAGARVTLVGDAARVDDDACLRSRFLRYQPKARELLALGDFSFWRVEPVALRFIGGFGVIRWVPVEEFAPHAGALVTGESRILEEMNAGHADTLRACCAHALGREVGEAIMLGVDCDGCDLSADGGRLRLDFRETVLDLDAVRREILELARKAQG